MKKFDEIIAEDLLTPDLLKIFRLSANWEKIMGEFIGKNSIPIKLSNNQLIIAVVDNIWMNEFSFMKAEFLERLHSYGYKFVSDIKFVVKLKPKMENKPSNPVEITDQMIEKAKNLSSVIKDQSLRERFEKAFLSYLSTLKEHSL
ncbi:DUF721 domain-containing protein [Calditerrivibrio nitroreducens]|uniref:DUF721 domain-containing protein n=1 Tax=Calditerrivibrio nitroreducens (strain DSM 19672 / NBRC 101217 / Yu37-1) TaxID=768670 RepID=E4TFT9_CALNY|nr:DUF721 domain-containing protein [Calditerrivibrio nitroreducens]ADR19595.1 protein of unknown function DUF721 [Calditerrivibrio nitroreducens DSM 19672]